MEEQTHLLRLSRLAKSMTADAIHASSTSSSSIDLHALGGARLPLGSGPLPDPGVPLGGLSDSFGGLPGAHLAGGDDLGGGAMPSVYIGAALNASLGADPSSAFGGGAYGDGALGGVGVRGGMAPMPSLTLSDEGFAVSAFLLVLIGVLGVFNNCMVLLVMARNPKVREGGRKDREPQGA